MAIIKNVLEEELERLERMQKTYEEKIDSLPKGVVQMKVIQNKQYPYLMFRVGNKVKTQYLKLNREEIQELKEKIEQRKKFEQTLKEIKKDIKIIKKVIKK